MRKHSFFLFVLLCLIQSCYSIAQTHTSSVTRGLVNDELEKFIYHIKMIPFDPNYINIIAQVTEYNINSIYSLIQADDLLPVSQKTKANHSLVFFLRDLSTDIDEKKVDIYDIPGAIRSYKVVLNVLLHH